MGGVACARALSETVEQMNGALLFKYKFTPFISTMVRHRRTRRAPKKDLRRQRETHSFLLERESKKDWLLFFHFLFSSTSSLSRPFLIIVENKRESPAARRLGSFWCGQARDHRDVMLLLLPFLQLKRPPPFPACGIKWREILFFLSFFLLAAFGRFIRIIRGKGMSACTLES